MDNVQENDPFAAPECPSSGVRRLRSCSQRWALLLAAVIGGAVIAPLLCLLVAIALGRAYITVYVFAIVLAFSIFATVARPTFSFCANLLFVVSLMIVLASVEFPELLSGKVPPSLQIRWGRIAMLFGCSIGTSAVGMLVYWLNPDLFSHWLAQAESKSEVR